MFNNEFAQKFSNLKTLVLGFDSLISVASVFDSIINRNNGGIEFKFIVNTNKYEDYDKVSKQIETYNLNIIKVDFSICSSVEFFFGINVVKQCSQSVEWLKILLNTSRWSSLGSLRPILQSISISPNYKSLLVSQNDWF